MAEKDIGEKLLEDYEEVFADIINVLAFHGERLLKPERLAAGPTVSRYKDAQGGLREHRHRQIRGRLSEAPLLRGVREHR